LFSKVSANILYINKYQVNSILLEYGQLITIKRRNDIYKIIFIKLQNCVKSSSYTSVWTSSFKFVIY